MHLRRRHWILALGLAGAAHLALVTLFLQPPRSGARDLGAAGVEIALGPAGGAAAATPEPVSEEVTAVPVPETAPLQPVESAEPVQAQPVEPAATAATAAEVEAVPVPVEPSPPEVKSAEPPTASEALARAVPEAPARAEPPADGEAPAAGSDPVAAEAEAQAPDDPRPGAGDATAGGGSPGARADYFARLQAWLERHRRYPRRAQLRGQEGTALLYFVIDRDGQVLDYRIERSSGYSVLDREVTQMLQRAEPLPEMPPELRQASLELRLPIEFAIH